MISIIYESLAHSYHRHSLLHSDYWIVKIFCESESQRFVFVASPSRLGNNLIYSINKI